LDGEVNLTVQLTDSEDKLVATKTTAYTKDVVYPKSYYSRTNLENQGTSSLDDFIIEVVIETQDVGGSYNLDIDNDGTSSKSNTYSTLTFSGELTSEVTELSNIDITSLENGVYKFDLIVTDPNGNIGEPETLYYLVEENKITLLGTTNTLSVLNNTLEKALMYPNPVNDVYHIETDEELLLEIFDIHGKLIKKMKIYPGRNSVNTHTISSGYYFFKLNNGKKQISKKVLKR